LAVLKKRKIKSRKNSGTPVFPELKAKLDRKFGSIYYYCSRGEGERQHEKKGGFMKSKLLPITFMILLVLTGFVRANEDAVITPTRGGATVPVKNDVLTSKDAITIPRMLSYQGRLTDNSGSPVPNGNYQLTFRLYQQENGGSPFWTETQTVSVQNGLFSVLLGSVTPITSLPDGGTVWLSLQVGAEPELSPRLRIVSAAYSFLSEKAQTLEVRRSTGQVDN
jgi:hypothetical protein